MPQLDDNEQEPEQRQPEQLRPQRHGGRRDDERRKREKCRRPRVETASARNVEHRADDRRRQASPDQDESRPSAELLDQPEDELGPPLLVEPRRPGDREGPGVLGRDRAGREHLGACAQLVRQVDRRHRRQEGGEDGQADREVRPQGAQRHAGMLCAPLPLGTAPMVPVGRV